MAAFREREIPDGESGVGKKNLRFGPENVLRRTAVPFQVPSRNEEMMKARLLLLLLLPLLGLAGAVLAWPERDPAERSETEIKLADTPRSVQATIAARML